MPGSTLTVAIEVTEPPEGGVTGLVAKVTCNPLAKLDVLKATAELKDPVDVTVTI